MTEEDRTVVVFLDTNALHFVHLYIWTKEQGLDPASTQGDGIAEEKKQPAKHRGNFEKGLNKGQKIVDSLAKRDVRVEYSPVSELELMAGRARGKAMENAAREGIPDRMWTRFHEKEVGARLNAADLTDIRTRVEGLGSALERAGIPATVSDPGRTRDVFDLAKDITELVYLGMADSVIYASALVAGADYLITGDEYFRDTVNRIKTGQEPYDEARRKLRDRIVRTLLVRPDDIDLPKAERVLPHGR